MRFITEPPDEDSLSPFMRAMYSLLAKPEVELIVSTNSPNGVIERKVYCRGGEQVQFRNSENISLPVACNGDRIVRIFFDDHYRSLSEASVQIVGYYRKC